MSKPPRNFDADATEFKDKLSAELVEGLLDTWAEAVDDYPDSAAAGTYSTTVRDRWEGVQVALADGLWTVPKARWAVRIAGTRVIEFVRRDRWDPKTDVTPSLAVA